MKRLMSRAAVLGVLLAPLPAFAALNQGILDGAQLVWDGTATCPNQIYVGLGGIDIQPTPTLFPTSGPQFITQASGVGCAVTANFFFATDTGGGQVASTAYYVYGVDNPDGGVLQWVISTNAPNQGGEPWTSLQYTSGGTVTTNHAIFVGSYITDGTVNHNMVPFLKKGDEVLLNPSVSTATQLDQNTGYQGSATFTPAGVYPMVSSITFPAGTPIPNTASALLIDFVVTNASNAFMDAYVLNPAIITDVGVGACKASPQYYMSCARNATPTSFNHARIKTGINTFLDNGALDNPLNTIELGVCQQPGGGNFEVTAAYVGYVEVTHHLSF